MGHQTFPVSVAPANFSILVCTMYYGALETLCLLEGGGVKNCTWAPPWLLLLKEMVKWGNTAAAMNRAGMTGPTSKNTLDQIIYCTLGLQS